MEHNIIQSNESTTAMHNALIHTPLHKQPSIQHNVPGVSWFQLSSVAGVACCHGKH